MIDGTLALTKKSGKLTNDYHGTKYTLALENRGQPFHILNNINPGWRGAYKIVNGKVMWGTPYILHKDWLLFKGKEIDYYKLSQ